MPKLPHISGLAIVKALERLGFEKLRQSGSHVVMGRNGKGCVVPMHSEVKVGTLAGLLRQAGLSPDEPLQPLPSPKKAIDRLLLDRYKGAEYKGHVEGVR